MPYTKTVWVGGAAPPMSADNFNHLETQYDLATEESLVIESGLALEGYEPTQAETAQGPCIEFAASTATESIAWLRRWPWGIYGCNMELTVAAATGSTGNWRVQVGYFINGGSSGSVNCTITPGTGTAFYTASLGEIVSAASLSTGAILSFTLSRIGGSTGDTHGSKMRLYHCRLTKGAS